MPYRIEESANNRATCKNKECKDNQIKIMKGELRFGSLVTVQEHSSWAWKHWGCVTPAQITNLNKEIDGDVELLDGADDISEENRTKISKALEEGHVADEDWKGDVEVNRPGAKGMRVKTAKSPKKKAKDEEDSAEEAESPVKAKAKAKGTKRGRAKEEDDDEAVADKAPAPKKARAKTTKAKVEDEDEEEAEAPPPKKARGRPKKATTAAAPEKAAPAQQSKSKAKAKPAAVESGDEPEIAGLDGAADPKPKAQRGRKKANAKETAGADAEAPKAKGRGRKKD